MKLRCNILICQSASPLAPDERNVLSTTHFYITCDKLDHLIVTLIDADTNDVWLKLQAIYEVFMKYRSKQAFLTRKPGAFLSFR